MEFKGTKGEWNFDDINMKIKGSGDIEGMTVIANVSPNMDYSRGMTTQKANAKLISCAPEMFEMLGDILKKLPTNTYASEKEQIEQLIQKATTL